MEDVSWIVANPGERISLGRSYYHTLRLNIGLRTDGGRAGYFGAVDPLGMDIVQKYEKALEKSEREGVKAQALMLCLQCSESAI